ncbi:DUF167 domain-containing protein [Zhongshania aquimaris]|uniref:UPF0235 protein KXJ70_10775 n=1 Tax=Zhongshania aquimaris TaxID=2857107 RepID=A0ABS6VSH5_9GAMM|nr:DUF167 family protein [Zhongshania aquimaris]MBW2941266.1 DUF167 family protein [Zhongshania aquimaris]
MPAFCRWQGDNLILFCHIQAGASANEFAGQHGDRLKIRVRSAAIEGKANASLCAFLAEQFAVSKQAVELSTGSQSRQKTFKILAPTTIPSALNIEQP